VGLGGVKAVKAMFFVGGFVLNLRAADPLQVSRDLHIHGDYRGAESVLREGLGSEPDNQRRAALLSSLGDLLREQDRGAEARPLFEQALDLSDVSWRTRFSALMGLADLDRQERRWTRSASQWNDAIKLAESHDDAIVESCAIRGLGETWLDQGNYARAEPLLKKALALTENNNRATPDIVALALGSLASLYRLQDKTSLAEELWTRQLSISRGFYGDYHPQTGLVLSSLADLSVASGDFSRARDYARQALSIMSNHFAANSIPVAAALINSAVIEEHAHDLEASAGFYGKALDTLRALNHPPAIAGLIAKRYAEVLSQLHRKREAKQVVAEFAAFRPAK